MSKIQRHPDNKGVLVIYTGGTIGSKPRDAGDPDSPQVVVSWEALKVATPEIRVLEDRGCKVACHAFAEPLDSCNVGPSEWQEIAQVIYDNYDNHDGFVILHGTDTMVYSGAALSFMLRDLGKPVVLTGAQRSALVDVRNDATQNFITALLVANPAFSGLPVIPEVVICFGGVILRGNRTAKDDTSGYTAYVSPNHLPLGHVGDRIIIHEELLLPRPGPDRRFHIRTRLSDGVMPLFIYPGIPTEQVKQQLALPGLQAVVVQAFGSGNIPTRPDLLAAFEEARGRGVVLTCVSQCRRGPVELGIYETSAALLEAGFVASYDIGVEAAQCKLRALLGDPDAEPDEVERQYQVSLAGEQSISSHLTVFETKPATLSGPSEEAPAVSRHRIPGRPLEGHWDPARVDRALLRFRGGRIDFDKDRAAVLRVYTNLDPEEELTPDHPSLAGEFKKWHMRKPGLVLFDVTRTMRSIGRPGDRISFTIALETPGARFEWNAAELALLIRETDS